MANHATSQNRKVPARAAPSARTSSKPLPRYLMLRGAVYYFKRKVPPDVAHAFPNARGGQVWKTLGTDLLEQARVLLAAELGEFELSAAKASRAAGMTLRHMLEAWKVTQPRHRTIHTFETAVDEFHTLHGALAAQDITRAHARRYRDTLVELIEHVLGNPFERIPVSGGQRQRVEKDRRAYTQQELNTIFSSKQKSAPWRHFSLRFVTRTSTRGGQLR